ncbi:hypothetical protein OSK81_23915, partial [Escherichia coli]|nr:hypothetical protein [Escherichia coli]
KRVFLVILFTSFSGSLVSRIPGAVQFAFADWTVAVPVSTAPSLNSAELATFAFGTKHTPILTRMLCP